MNKILAKIAPALESTYFHMQIHRTTQQREIPIEKIAICPFFKHWNFCSTLISASSKQRIIQPTQPPVGGKLIKNAFLTRTPNSTHSVIAKILYFSRLKYKHWMNRGRIRILFVTLSISSLFALSALIYKYYVNKIHSTCKLGAPK